MIEKILGFFNYDFLLEQLTSRILIYFDIFYTKLIQFDVNRCMFDAWNWIKKSIILIYLNCFSIVLL